MKRPVRNSLAWRLYAVGVLQVLLVAVAVVVIGMVVARLQAHGDVQGLVARLESLIARPAALSKELAELRTRERLLLSLYDDERKLIASNVAPPLPLPRWSGRGGAPSARPPDSEGPFHPGPHHGSPFGRPPPFGGPPPFGRPPHHHPPPEMYARIEVHDREGLLVARFEPPKPSFVPPLLTFAFGLAVIGVGAFLTARWIVRPLERLSETARALGAGDLRARTDLKRSDELGEVGRAFDDMADRVQTLLLAEKELLANVAHELRTPLARIRVALEIANEADAQAARAQLADIAIDLAELETLIDDVLTATRLAIVDGNTSIAGFALHLEEIAPAAMGEDAAVRFRSRHENRPLALSIDESLPVIEADPVLFRRVIDNLLENANKYSPDATRPIELRVIGHADHVTFEIEDRGMGIAEKDLPHVFTAFFRGERSRSRGTGGVGLGLTLAKRIVEAHAGTIDVVSKEGSGTIVRVVIPTRSHASRAV